MKNYYVKIMNHVLRQVGIWIGYSILAITALVVVSVVGIGLIANPVATVSVVLLSGLLVKLFSLPFNQGKKRWAIGLLFVASILGYFVPSVCAAILSVAFTYWWKSAKRINQLRYVDRNPAVESLPANESLPVENMPAQSALLPVENLEVNNVPLDFDYPQIDGNLVDESPQENPEVAIVSFEEFLKNKGLQINLNSNLQDENSVNHHSDRLVPMELDVSDQDTRDLNDHE